MHVGVRQRWRRPGHDAAQHARQYAGCSTVSAWPMSEDFRYLKTWLVWRRGAVSRSLSMFVKLLEEGLTTS